MSVAYGKLIEQVEEIEDRTGLLDYRAITYWFIETVFGMKSDEITNSICDGTHDKGIDAVLIDDREKHITIIQSKFERAGGQRQIKDGEIKEFAAVRSYFESRSAYKAAVVNANKTASRLLDQAYELKKKRNYTLELLFLTTHQKGPQTEGLVYEALGFKPSEFTIYDYQRMVHLVKDKERDFVPHLPPYSLPYSNADSFLLRTENSNSWVLTVPLRAIRSMATAYGDSLFRKNVRNFLGFGNETNRGIQKTIKSHPEDFWYYNNGMTILCDRASIIQEKGYIRLENPQVVNGCQTAMSIHAFKGDLNGDVLVRVIESSDHDFIGRITMYQNSSNPVSNRDFKSNDPIQVRLKRELGKKGYYYEIKRGEDFDTMRKKYPSMNQIYEYSLSNEVVAELLACIRISPSVAASKGRKAFFGEHYEDIFDESIATYQVLAPWILRVIVRESYGGESEPFYEFEKSYVFKNRALFHVIKIMDDAMKGAGISDWHKKLVLFWENSSIDEWMRFAERIDRIISSLFKTIHKGYKKSGESYHNTYLQKKGILKQLRKNYTQRMESHKTKIRTEFVKVL